MSRRYGVYIMTLMSVGCFGGEVPSGEACGARDQCEQNHACISLEQESEEGVCLEQCDPNTTRLCGDGSVCNELSDGQGVCNQIGGEKLAGQACIGSNDCEVGAVCLQDVSGDAVGYCWRACEVDGASVCPQDQTCKSYGADGFSVCQPDLLGFCGVDIDGEVCAQGYECGVSPNTTSTQEFTAFAARCNISGCAEDSDCPQGSMCRDFHGTYSRDDASFLAPTANASSARYCYADCQGQDACGAVPLYECMDASSCAGLEGEQACTAFVGEAALCVPTF